ncbi:hypothetical protein BZA77DRAFT_390693 [Pyronema omphalodes]|nr:hypothetical protein BZA77DRAFT_390693 [Pyronema omphalodes]
MDTPLAASAYPRQEGLSVNRKQDKQPFEDFSEMFEILDGQIMTAKNLKNTVVQFIIQMHLQAKAYAKPMEETTPLKKLLALVKTHINDLILQKEDSEKKIAEIIREHHESTTKLAQRIGMLEQEQAGLQQAIECMSDRNRELQNGACLTDNDVGSTDVATALLKHQEIAHEFQQVKNNIQCEALKLSAEMDNIVHAIQTDIAQNENTMKELLQNDVSATRKVLQVEAVRSQEISDKNVEGYVESVAEQFPSNAPTLLLLIRDVIIEYIKRNKEIITGLADDGKTMDPPCSSVEKVDKAKSSLILETSNNDPDKRMSSPVYDSFMSRACPTKVLEVIIYSLEDYVTQPFRNEFPKLRLVNRHFNDLLRPLYFESISLPPDIGYLGPTVTSDARQLLRLIDSDPTLAAGIQCLNYDDPSDLLDSLPPNLESLHLSDEGWYFCHPTRRDLVSGNTVTVVKAQSQAQHGHCSGY